MSPLFKYFLRIIKDRGIITQACAGVLGLLKGCSCVLPGEVDMLRRTRVSHYFRP